MQALGCFCRSIYQDNRWYELQQERESGPVECFHMDGEYAKVYYWYTLRKAGNVGGREYFDIVTPRGFGGPYFKEGSSLSEEEAGREFDRVFGEYCGEKGIIAEYVKFDPYSTSFRCLSDLYNVERHGVTFCNRLDADFYNVEYSPNVRNRIRKAQKNCVEISIDYSGKLVRDFLALYDFTRKKHRVGAYYDFDEAFLNRYFQVLNGNVCILAAKYQGRIISSIVVISSDEMMHYHMGGSDPQYRSLEANSLLLYEAALHGKEKGLKLFDFGGSKSGSSVESFKKKFVKSEGVLPYYVGKKIRNAEIYGILADWSGKPRTDYFPSYRALDAL